MHWQRFHDSAVSDGFWLMDNESRISAALSAARLEKNLLCSLLAVIFSSQLYRGSFSPKLPANGRSNVPVPVAWWHHLWVVFSSFCIIKIYNDHCCVCSWMFRHVLPKQVLHKQNARVEVHVSDDTVTSYAKNAKKKQNKTWAYEQTFNHTHVSSRYFHECAIHGWQSHRLSFVRLSNGSRKVV